MSRLKTCPDCDTELVEQGDICIDADGEFAQECRFDACPNPDCDFEGPELRLVGEQWPVKDMFRSMS